MWIRCCQHLSTYQYFWVLGARAHFPLVFPMTRKIFYLNFLFIVDRWLINVQFVSFVLKRLFYCSIYKFLVMFHQREQHPFLYSSLHLIIFSRFNLLIHKSNNNRWRKLFIQLRFVLFEESQWEFFQSIRLILTIIQFCSTSWSENEWRYLYLQIQEKS